MVRLGVVVVVLGVLVPAASATALCPVDTPDEPAGPVTVHATPTSAPTGTEIAFSSTGAAPKHMCVAVALTGVAWDFGDGSTAATVTPTHAYAHSGVYTVSATRTYGDVDAVTGTASVTITNRPPVAQIVDPGLVRTGALVAFSSGGSSDPDGSLASLQWTFGDGGVGSGSSPGHTFASRGTFSVGLTVLDNEGTSAQASRSVTVRDLPGAAFTAAGDSPSPGSATFDASTSTADPALTLTTYGWSFGDGSPDVAGPSPTATHTYASAGTFPVVLTVTDSTGATATRAASVSVTALTLGAPPSTDGSSPGSSPPSSSSPPSPSQHAATAQCVVPSLKGKTLSSARTGLTRAHCKLGKVSHATAPRRSVGRVLSSTPKAGKKLRAGSRVAIIIGSARRGHHR